MNYSNMIEEKNLKKTFIIATLISTVVGTFTASINLHDRVQEKRQKAKQKQLDETQTGQIDQLQKEVKRLQAKESSHGDSSSSRSSSRSRRKSRRGGSDDDDEFARSSKRSRAMIEDQYDDFVSRMGSRYARGDVITENKLQALIIALQQTVINVLQDALLNDRQLSKSDIQKLVTAQQSARAGTLEALQDQYYRMRIDNNGGSSRHSSRLLLEDTGGGPVQRQRTLPAPAQRDDFPSPRRVQSFPITAHDSLFCRYSEDLQLDGSRNLVASFDGNSDCRCPACGVRLDVDDTRSWIVETPDGSQQYALNARFMIKSHMTDGRYACMICDRTRDTICTCASAQSLLRHITLDHGIDALQGEIDCERRS